MYTGLKPIVLSGVYEDLAYEIEKEVKLMIEPEPSGTGIGMSTTPEEIENTAKIVTQALILLQEDGSQNIDQYTGIVVGKYYLETNKLLLNILIRLAKNMAFAQPQLTDFFISQAASEVVIKFNEIYPALSEIRGFNDMMEKRIERIGKEEYCAVVSAYMQHTAKTVSIHTIMETLKPCPYGPAYQRYYREPCKRCGVLGCEWSRDDVLKTLQEKGKKYGIEPLEGNETDFLLVEEITKVFPLRNRKQER